MNSYITKIPTKVKKCHLKKWEEIAVHDVFSITELWDDNYNDQDISGNIKTIWGFIDMP